MSNIFMLTSLMTPLTKMCQIEIFLKAKIRRPAKFRANIRTNPFYPRLTCQ